MTRNVLTNQGPKSLAHLSRLRVALRKHARPITCTELAGMLDLSVSRTSQLLLCLRGDGAAPLPRELRIAEWEFNPSHHFSPLFDFGTAPDLPRPVVSTRRASFTFATQPARVKIDTLRALLAERPRSAQQLAEAEPTLFLTRRCVTKYLHYLRGMDKGVPAPQEIRICRWTADSRTPVYGLGTAPDAPQPCLDPAARDLRYYKKKMADPKRHAQAMETMRIGRARRTGKLLEYCQPELAYLFGMVKRSPEEQEVVS